MAFFSNIKKFWTGPDEVGEEPASAESGRAAEDSKSDERATEKKAGAELVEGPGEEPGEGGEGVEEDAAPGPTAATVPDLGSAPDLEAGVNPDLKAGSAPDLEKAASPPPEEAQAWHADLLAVLAEDEPRISRWLDIILRDVSEAGPVLWERLHALFSALDVSPAEAAAFVTDFQNWLAQTGGNATADFRSDLQYRLALALDMEEAPEEKKRFWHKLFQGLARTRNSIAGGFYELFNGPGELDEAFWDELEELLITSDVGMEAAGILLGRLKDEARKSNAASRLAIEALFIAEISAIFKPYRRLRPPDNPEVVLLVGVNGAGKTTTIAKLAYRAKLQGRKVLLAAGDTFRAAAIEQLETWAGRVGVGFHAKTPGADPAAVAFEAMDRAAADGADLVFVDTAGRLQTKVNLMEELSKISRTLQKKVPGAPHRCVLVLDATTGQNALSQVKLFNAAAKVDEIILSKLDGTAKGGVAVGIALEFGIPISFIGLGEKMEDLRPFDPQAFAKALLGLDAPGERGL